VGEPVGAVEREEVDVGIGGAVIHSGGEVNATAVGEAGRFLAVRAGGGEGGAAVGGDTQLRIPATADEAIIQPGRFAQILPARHTSAGGLIDPS
ncbi:MAG: hypothetical protein ACK55I_40100, partial [bacterium]